MYKDTSRVKVVLVGEPAVGKTSIVRKYTMNTFSDKYLPTIVMDFYARDIDGLVLDMWDLSGHPEFFDERGKYYEGTQALILVFDISSRRTFDSLDMWVNESNVFSKEKPFVILCANKIDLVNQRTVPKNEAEYWALSRNMKYYEVSALEGESINIMFEYCASEYKSLFQNMDN